MNEFEVGSGRTRLLFAWRRWGPDLHVHIAGGDHHIGAACLCGRQSESRTYEGTLAVPPHKEDTVVARAAAVLHRAVGVNVCVTAGIHLDGITPDEIAAVLRIVDEGVARVIADCGLRIVDCGLK